MGEKNRGVRRAPPRKLKVKIAEDTPIGLRNKEGGNERFCKRGKPIWEKGLQLPQS